MKEKKAEDEALEHPVLKDQEEGKEPTLEAKMESLERSA